MPCLKTNKQKLGKTEVAASKDSETASGAQVGATMALMDEQNALGGAVSGNKGSSGSKRHLVPGPGCVWGQVS